jgi:hypothetical protein
MLGVLLLAAPETYADDNEYRNVSLGAIADIGYGSSAGGDTILAELGAEYVGIQTFRSRSLLVQWDTLLAARGGIVGNTLPYTSVAGGHTLANAEAGYRFQRHGRFSFYLGGRLNGDLSIVTHPGTTLGELNRLNNADGVLGVNASGAVRVDLGLSMLDGKRSLVLVAFFQEAGIAPDVYTSGIAYSEGGVAARFDIARRLTASLEAFAGRGATRTQAALDTTVQSSYAALSGVVRGSFRNGIWLALSGMYGREFDHRVYRASMTTYNTANAPDFNVTLLLGIPFVWNKKMRHEHL